MLTPNLTFLDLAGWHPGPPPNLDPALVAEDAAIAEQPCDKCGGKTEFHPYHRPKSIGSGSYRAIVACTECGYAYDF